MTDALGRTVLHRHRFARSWGLGDRKQPVSRTPGLVLLVGDPNLPLEYAPFSSTTTNDLPGKLAVESRGPFCPPLFDAPSPAYNVTVGHVLPPSLEEANAGEAQGTSALLPVSWQRMHHDDELMNPDLSPEIVVLTDAVQLASQSRKLPQAIMTLKRRFPGALLWTPGLAGPDNIASLTLMGVDLFDMARSREASAHGALLTLNGPRFPLSHETSSMEAQAYHWMKALDEVRAALEQGTLATLATQQSLASPRLVEHLRIHHALMAQHDDVLDVHVDAATVFPCYSPTVFDDPLVVGWESFITQAYTTPKEVSDVMILLPCSARKPYRLSKTHIQFIRAIGSTACHEVMVTSPLGLVPRDLEDVWPAGHYDIPVTGDWSEDERLRVQRMIEAMVQRNGYRRIINHTDTDLSFLNVEVVNTRQGQGSTHHESLERLNAAVKDAIQTYALTNQKNSLRLKSVYKSVARKTMLNDEWLNEIDVRGKLPRWRLEHKGTQVAVWSIDRNAFSFSRAAIDVLHEHRSLRCIHLHDDVTWKGDVFSHLVDNVDSGVRTGEDLLVMQGGQPVGLARAVAPGWEWNGTPGTLAKSHQRKK